MAPHIGPPLPLFTDRTGGSLLREGVKPFSLFTARFWDLRDSADAVVWDGRETRLFEVLLESMLRIAALSRSARTIKQSDIARYGLRIAALSLRINTAISSCPLSASG